MPHFGHLRSLLLQVASRTPPESKETPTYLLTVCFAIPLKKARVEKNKRSAMTIKKGRLVKPPK
jgi:hypothetical protein